MTDATDAERCWQDGLSDALLTFRCQAVPVGPDPAGGVVSESVGEVGVVSISAGPQRWIRSPREVRDGGRGRAVGLTVVEGEVEVAQGATKRTLRPGATGLIDGALPSTVDIAGEVRIACLVLSRDLFAKRCLRRGATPGMPDAPRGVAAPVSAFIAELPEALTDPELSSPRSSTPRLAFAGTAPAPLLHWQCGERCTSRPSCQSQHVHRRESRGR